MSANFNIKSYSSESFVCALLLTFLTFSILPISLYIAKPEKKKSSDLVRVYVRKDTNLNSENNRRNSNFAENFLLPITHTVSTPILSEPRLDFSSIKIGEPNLSAKGGFSIASFALGETSFDGGGIVTFEIEQLDKIPRRLNSVRVNYPRDLLRRGVEGDVKLNVIIDENGNVEVDSVLSSTDSRFESAAISAASKLKYEQPTRAGKPVRASFVLPIPFKILK